MKRTLIATSLALSLALGCHKPTQTEHAKEAPHHAPHWTYEGEDGPAHWSELDASFQGCATGKEQSPINIQGATPNKALGELQFSYQESPIEVVNNGHTIQFNYAPGSKMTFQGKEYELVQFHFHNPSEHQLNGESFPAEVHFVHKDSAGKLAVIGVMLEEGAENQPLSSLWKNLPNTPGKLNPNTSINAAELIPEGGYFTYHGSLTTPGCGEGVTWIVMKSPSSLSQEQLGTFAAIVGPNARPVQALNSRTVEDF